MSYFKYDDVNSVPCANISKDGIRYGKHEFNAKVTVKDPESKKDIEITVVRRAEREWMLGLSAQFGSYSFLTQHGGIVFSMDPVILKSKAEEIQKFIFGK